MTSPLISVILPVYNCEKYILDSVGSILNQSYKNIQLIVINDGSSDGTLDKLKTIHDHRVQVIDQHNMGLPCALNEGLKKATGSFIARQDADDISLPSRLEKQVNFLIEHEEYGLIGSPAQFISNDDPLQETSWMSLTNEKALNFFMYFDNPLIHTSVMFKKSVIESIGLYETNLNRQPPEDYEFWLRIIKHWKVRNSQEILVQYRILKTSFSRKISNPFPQLSQLSAEYISSKLDIPLEKALDLAKCYKSNAPDKSPIKLLSRIYLLNKIALQEKYFGKIYFYILKCLIKNSL